MSALDDMFEVCRRGEMVHEILLDAVAKEFSQLQAERDEQREAARLAFKHRKQVEAERDEQARQLAEARNVISAYRGLPTGPKGYTSYPLFDLHNAADDWFAANPAPESQPPNGEGRP